MTRVVAHCCSVLAFLLAGSLVACSDGGEAHVHELDPGHGEHAHVAPHGGDLIVCRAEFAHVEVVLDSETGTLTAYLLGAHAEKPERSTASGILARVTVDEKAFDVTFAAVANELSGESVGDTSQVRAIDARLVGAEHVEGTLLSAQLRGETFIDLPFHVPAH